MRYCRDLKDLLTPRYPLGLAPTIDMKAKAVKHHEETKPVRTVRVSLRCECGGEYKSVSGVVLASMPPQYPHECDKCGEELYVEEKTYPRIEFVSLEESKPRKDMP